MKQELTVRMNKELIRMRKNLENKKQAVYSRWTQVEAGDLPVDHLPLDHHQDADTSAESVNLLAK